MSDGRHCKHGLHVAEGCAICFGSDSKTWRGTYIDLAYTLARDNEPDWMRSTPVVVLPAADFDALVAALAEAERERDAARPKRLCDYDPVETTVGDMVMRFGFDYTNFKFFAESITKLTAALRAARKREGALTQSHTHALNLLAVLHGDGGHYTAEHGFEKSCKDAQTVYYEKLTTADKRAFDAEQALADAKADVKNPASLRLLVSELESRCRKADESIQQCRTYLRGCMNHAFDETPIVEVAKDVTEEFHRNRYQIQCMAKERDTIAKERDVANLLLKRLMCVVVPDNVVPNDMKEFIRDSAATVLKDLYDYLKTDVDLRKAEHDAR